jgi:CO dehydrogenase/acetyl-CoA synthase epsilon subunit
MLTLSSPVSSLIRLRETVASGLKKLGDPLMIIADNVNPGSVSNFQAVGSDGQIALSWTNPTDPDFAGVKIIRKAASYPTSVTDGTELYSGTGNSYNNTGLANGVSYYYAAFAFDSTHNFSTIAADSKASAYAHDEIAPGAVTQLTAVTSTGLAK